MQLEKNLINKQKTWTILAIHLRQYQEVVETLFTSKYAWNRNLKEAKNWTNVELKIYKFYWFTTKNQQRFWSKAFKERTKAHLGSIQTPIIAPFCAKILHHRCLIGSKYASEQTLVINFWNDSIFANITD